MAQQTAVDWYYEQTVIQGKTNYAELLQQAKQMEKEQMIELTQTLTSTPSDISRDMATFIVENFINNLNEISNK